MDYLFNKKIEYDDITRSLDFDSAIRPYVFLIYNSVKKLSTIFPNQKINCLELGIWSGSSTRSILAAVNDMNAFLTSIDIVDYSNYFNPELNKWRFILGDSTIYDLQDNFHFIFVDTAHKYEDTKKEIKHCLPKLYVNGIMMFHDIVFAKDDVLKAIEEFLHTDMNLKKVNFTTIDSFPGLGIMTKLSDDINYNF